MIKPQHHEYRYFFPDLKSQAVNTLFAIIYSIIDQESANLNKLKKSLGKYIGKEGTNVDSHYKRLTRFFVDHFPNKLWMEVLACVFQLLNHQVRYLVLDGTSWHHGKESPHYLTLSVLYRGVAIPIYWLDIDKKGASNEGERMLLINLAMRYFNLSNLTLIGDREYVGKRWFKFLMVKGIKYIIRVNKGYYKTEVNAAKGLSYQQMEAKVLASSLENKRYSKQIVINGCSLTFIIVKNRDKSAQEPLLYLIAYTTLNDRQIVKAYSSRWLIECCFKHLKSNGFDMEKINLGNSQKRRLLMALIVFAYVIAIHEGLKDYKKVAVKKYKNGKNYKAVSVFRYGFDCLVNTLRNGIEWAKYIIHEIQRQISKKRSNLFFVQ